MELRDLPEGRVRASDVYAALFPEQALETAAEFMARMTGVDAHEGRRGNGRLLFVAPGPSESQILGTR